MSVSYDKILPAQVYQAPGNPYFVPFSGISSITQANVTATNVSATNATIQNASINSLLGIQGFVSSMGVSSINGAIYPLPLQTSATNPPARSGLAIPPSVWTPLVSTVNAFQFIGGKSYDVQFPLGANITQASSNANQTFEFGVGTQGQTVPTVCYSIHTLTTAPTQIGATGLLRATIVPATDEVSPLVSYTYPIGSSDTATMSVGGAGNAVNPFVVKSNN